MHLGHKINILCICRITKQLLTGLKSQSITAAPDKIIRPYLFTLGDIEAVSRLYYTCSLLYLIFICIMAIRKDHLRKRFGSDTLFQHELKLICKFRQTAFVRDPLYQFFRGKIFINKLCIMTYIKTKLLNAVKSDICIFYDERCSCVPSHALIYLTHFFSRSGY
ncbi:MAG: hypothetical protein BWY61_00390 [Firmicutes bacterium ADurb.Bin354]|nr:MAG: hypothetical protein BWY61_00390 [Firmicutes bacterium ADurb.Bin354]